MYIGNKSRASMEISIEALLLFQYENTPHFTVEGNLNMY